MEEHSNTNRIPYLYNGKELDEETGLYYYGARYYDARTSVFLSIDPLAESYPMMSPYAYAANNPIRYMDWMGMGPCETGDCPDATTNEQIAKADKELGALAELHAATANRLNDSGNGASNAIANTNGSRLNLDPSNTNGGKVSSTEELAATALIMVLVPEPMSTATGAVILGGIAAITVTAIFADEIVAGVTGAYEWMKGGKQRQRDRDYGLPPELIDWWHNGGGKAGHGGQDIGSEYGPAPVEILQEWKDLGRPSGSKPKGGRRYKE